MTKQSRRRQCDFNIGDRVIKDGEAGVITALTFEESFQKWIATILLDDERVECSFTWALTKEGGINGRPEYK